MKNTEWFTGSIVLDDIIDIFTDYRNTETSPERIIYTPRDEQRKAINDLKKYFDSNPVVPRFLLNCKMRFGKCYTTYKYAEEVNHKKILILTFVPAVEDSWREDLNHIVKEYDYFTDFELRREDFKLENDPKAICCIFIVTKLSWKEIQIHIKPKTRLRNYKILILIY